MEYEVGPTETITSAVVRAVCAVQGRDPCSLRPLAEVLDPDALEVLFEARRNGSPRVGGRLSFVFGHCDVVVENGEYIKVDPIVLQSRNDGSD